MKKTINQPCPMCGSEINFSWTPDHEWTHLNDTYMAWMLPKLHCTPCVELTKRLTRCQNAISDLNEKIRSSASDAEQLKSLQGALSAQYSSRKLIQKKIDARQRITRPTSEETEMDKTAPSKLPW